MASTEKPECKWLVKVDALSVLVCPVSWSGDSCWAAGNSAEAKSRYARSKISEGLQERGVHIQSSEQVCDSVVVFIMQLLLLRAQMGSRTMKAERDKERRRWLTFSIRCLHFPDILALLRPSSYKRQHMLKHQVHRHVRHTPSLVAGVCHMRMGTSAFRAAVDGKGGFALILVHRHSESESEPVIMTL